MHGTPSYAHQPPPILDFDRFHAEPHHEATWQTLDAQQRERMERSCAQAQEDPSAFIVGLGNRLVVFGQSGMRTISAGFFGQGSYGQEPRPLIRAIAEANGQPIALDVGRWLIATVETRDERLDVTIEERRSHPDVGTLSFAQTAPLVRAWAHDWLAAHPLPTVSDLGLLVLDWLEAHEVRGEYGVVVPAGIARRRSVTECAKALGRKRPEVIEVVRGLRDAGLLYLHGGSPVTMMMRRNGQLLLADEGFDSRAQFVMPPPEASPIADDIRVEGRRWMVLALIAPDGTCDQVVHRLMPRTHPQEAISKAIDAHSKATNTSWQVHPDVPLKVLAR